MVIMVVCLCLVGCGGGTHDARLTAINDSTTVNPERAVAALDTIDVATLSDRDRHYYDLLTVKARDKAYITHTSDSLILSVIDYYRSHDSEHLPEALYYGGRVYSDLGDYPTALTYFQDALDVTPADDINLLGRLNSQTGRLLNAIRQYRLANPYLKESIRIDSIEKDTFGLAFNNQLLSSNYVGQCKYDSASYYIDNAVKYTQTLTALDKADISICLAAVEYHKGNHATAIDIIRSYINNASETFRWLALSYACDIYYDAQKYDSVYFYARQLCYAPLDQNQRFGYLYLQKPEVRKYLPGDSVDIFADKYYNAIKDYLHSHDAESTLWQSTRYNYNVHEKKRKEAEQSNLWLERTIYSISIILLLCICVIMFMKYRNTKNLVSLKEAQKEIQQLRNELEHTPMKKENMVELREHLKEKLLNILSHTDSVRHIPADIEQMSKSLFEHYNKNMFISESDPIWNRITEKINSQNPQFYKYIDILTLGKLNPGDMRILELIRCGITPTQMSHILGKAKGTISSRRASMSERMFDKSIGNTEFDFIIRSL